MIKSSKIAAFSIIYTLFMGLVCTNAYADEKLNIDLDMDNNYRNAHVKGNLQGKLEDLDKSRSNKSNLQDEWLKFHNNGGFARHTPGSGGNRAMADEINNSSKYTGTNLDPLNKNEEFDSVGFTGRIGLN